MAMLFDDNRIECEKCGGHIFTKIKTFLFEKLIIKNEQFIKEIPLEDKIKCEKCGHTMDHPKQEKV